MLRDESICEVGGYLTTLYLDARLGGIRSSRFGSKLYCIVLLVLLCLDIYIKIYRPD